MTPQQATREAKKYITSGQYKKDRFEDVCAMFDMISKTTNYISYFDMEQFICSLPLPIIKQIMSCLFISYEDNTYLPKQAPRLSIDTDDRMEDLEAEICYIPRHYGTVDTTGPTTGPKSKSKTPHSPQPNKMISKLRSCFGFSNEYMEIGKEDEREAFFQ